MEGDEINPKIVIKDDFIVCDMETKLTQSQTQNIAIATNFWKDFNAQLRQANIFQNNKRRKYAFTYVKNNEHYYFCAIPDRSDIPDTSQFNHYEKYTEKFQWNKETSIIYIYVPVTKRKV